MSVGFIKNYFGSTEQHRILKIVLKIKKDLNS
jgi:hypothetical protein